MKDKFKNLISVTWTKVRSLHIPTKSELKQFFKDWILLGNESESYEKVKTKYVFPLRNVIVVLITAASLFVIVFSSVLVSYNERQVLALKAELEALEEERTKLEDELVKKNDPVMLEQMAKDMGMISNRYLEFVYNPDVEEERIIVYTYREKRMGSIGAVLSKLGLVP